MNQFGLFLEKKDPQRYFWCGKAAAFGLSGEKEKKKEKKSCKIFCKDDFFACMVEQLKQLDAISSSVVFEIGRAVKGKINEEKKEILGLGLHPSSEGDVCEDKDDESVGVSLIEQAQSAVRFYLSNCLQARKAVDCWTVVAIRNGVVKDIRLMISKYIWGGRSDGEYKI
jgi:hypothetical protein